VKLIAKQNDTIESTEHDSRNSETWLSPVHKLNFDTLSMIFIIAWDTKEGSQWILASVCRHWRDVALATPRLWSRLSTLPPEDEEYLQAILSRSATLPLHIIIHDLTNQQQLRTLSMAKERIHCMTVRDEVEVFETSFSSLRRIELSVFGGRPREDITEEDPPSLLDVHKFPELCELYLSSCPDWVLTAIEPAKRFPPLQRLHIICDSSSFWLSIINNCRDSLVSLTMLLGYPPPPHGLHLILPKLRHLELAGRGVGMRIDAPLLESLEEGKFLSEGSRRTPSLPHSPAVTELYSSRLPLELARSPQLKTLWLSSEENTWEELGAHVQEGIDACPHLRFIGYRHGRYSRDILGIDAVKRVLLGDVLASERLITVEEFSPSQMQLPGSMPRVGHGHHRSTRTK
jgi:F-box-like